MYDAGISSDIFAYVPSASFYKAFSLKFALQQQIIKNFNASFLVYENSSLYQHRSNASLSSSQSYNSQLFEIELWNKYMRLNRV